MYRLLDIVLDKCFHNSILPILSADFIAGLWRVGMGMTQPFRNAQCSWTGSCDMGVAAQAVHIQQGIVFA